MVLTLLCDFFHIIDQIFLDVFQSVLYMTFKVYNCLDLQLVNAAVSGVIHSRLQPDRTVMNWELL